MPVRLILILSFFSIINDYEAIAQLPNISFNTNNAWSKPGGVSINTAQNQATIIGNGNDFSTRTTLDIKLQNIPSDLYFIAEVKLTGVVYNNHNIKNPQLTIRSENNAVLARINLEFPMEGKWFTTGVKLSEFTSDKIKVEAGINSTTGKMEIRNPYLSTIAPSLTYHFPFDLPASANTKINIQLDQKLPFENDLLSSNTHFVFAKKPWSYKPLQEAINLFFPMSNLRFPGGSVGNWYNYKTDNFHETDKTPTNLLNYNKQGNTLDYNGFNSFVKSTGSTASYMLNIMLGSRQSAINEYQERFDTKLPIKWLELGNELYLSENQQANNVSDAKSYIDHAKAISNGIKTINPNQKVSVCIEKDDFTSQGWNVDLAKDQSYFDAVTLHNYNATGMFFHSDYSSFGVLTGYKTSQFRFKEANTLFPNKSLLLTEWGITGNVDDPYFVESLGLADMFIATIDANQKGIVKQAGVHMLYKNDENSTSTLMFFDKEKVKLTTKGVLYAKLFEVFKNSDVFLADNQSMEISKDLKGVYGKMTKKGNLFKYFVVNKLPVVSPLEISFNGKNYIGEYTLEIYSHDLNKICDATDADNNTSWKIQNSKGAMSIPPSSIAIFSLKEDEVNKLLSSVNNYEQNIIHKYFPNPTDGILNITNTDTQDVKIFNTLGIDWTYKADLSKLDSGIIDLRELPDDIYFVMIGYKNCFKVIKN